MFVDAEDCGIRFVRLDLFVFLNIDSVFFFISFFNIRNSIQQCSYDLIITK